MGTASRSPAPAGSRKVNTAWSLPRVDHPGVDILERQRRAIRKGEAPLPYPGLPRDRVANAIDLVLRFDPDKVYLFGSTVRGEDTLRSDIDILVASTVCRWTSGTGGNGRSDTLHGSSARTP
ncbi:MAG: nucleotidyltransferase domain-containing protein [bacterium]|nr:nucleotidyltransferase domain-containing protein [bacterium]